MNRYTLVLLTMLSLQVAADTRAQPEIENMSQLLSGKILHEHTHLDEAGAAISARILMRATVGDIWVTITGCKNANRFVEGLKVCEFRQQSSDYAVIRQVVDKGAFAPNQDYTYESKRQPYTRIDFKLLEGSMKSMQGSWEFIDVAEGVVIIYNMRVEPGWSVPDFLVRKDIRRTIPNMLACIRGLVKGSGSPKQNRKDLGRCSADADESQAKNQHDGSKGGLGARY